MSFQAVSNGNFIDLCLAMLVRNFMPPYNFLDSLTEPHGLSRKAHVLSRVHSALESISRLVPLAPTRLPALVLQEMPRIQEKDKIGQTAAVSVFFLLNCLCYIYCCSLLPKYFFLITGLL